MYKEKLERLPEALARDADEAREALRDLIGEITVIEEDTGVWAEIPSYGGRLQMNLVAGVGFEPTTFGL